MPRPIAQIAGKMTPGSYQVRLETLEATSVGKNNLAAIRWAGRVVSNGSMQGKNLSWLRFLAENSLWKLGNDVMTLGATESEMPAPPEDSPDKIAAWLANQYINKILNVEVSERPDETNPTKKYTDVEVLSIAPMTSDGFASAPAAAAAGSAPGSPAKSFDGV